MGTPHSVPESKRATKATLFFSVEEIRALHQRWRQLVPKDNVVYEDSFAAFCLWSQICRPETAQVLFRAFDVLKRKFFDFEDFVQTSGMLARGSPEQVSEVLFRMLSAGPPHHHEPRASSSAPYDTPAGSPELARYIVRYQDVVDSIKKLDTSFLCLRCDGGTTPESIAARLPFDEFGHLPFASLLKKVEERL